MGNRRRAGSRPICRTRIKLPCKDSSQKAIFVEALPPVLRVSPSLN